MNVKEDICKGNKAMPDSNESQYRKHQQQTRSSRKINFMSGGQS